METENQKLRERVEVLNNETLLLAHQVTNLTHQLKRAMEAAGTSAPSATAPSAVFEGYVDGMPRITWCGEALPAGTVLYASAPSVSAPQPVDAAHAVPTWEAMMKAHYAQGGSVQALGAPYFMQREIDAYRAAPSPAAQPAAQAGIPVPKDAKLWSDGIWRDSSGNELGLSAAPVAQTTDTTKADDEGASRADEDWFFHPND